MSDIFVSYARKDAHMAEPIVRILEGRGWSVFWDQRIPVGTTWRRHTSIELDQARAVIVLWTTTSVHSEWVIEEAEEAKNRGVYVPVRIGDIMPPLGLRHIQAATLPVGKEYSNSDPSIQLLLQRLKELLKREAQNASDTQGKGNPRVRRFSLPGGKWRVSLLVAISIATVTALWLTPAIFKDRTAESRAPVPATNDPHREQPASKSAAIPVPDAPKLDARQRVQVSLLNSSCHPWNSANSTPSTLMIASGTAKLPPNTEIYVEFGLNLSQLPAKKNIFKKMECHGNHGVLKATCERATVDSAIVQWSLSDTKLGPSDSREILMAWVIDSTSWELVESNSFTIECPS